MDFWIAKSRKEYSCDICRKRISKGERRVVVGHQSLVYVMIDRNICLECCKEIKKLIEEDEKLKGGEK